MTLRLLLFVFVFFYALSPNIVYSEEQPFQPAGPEPIGEIFGTPVPKSNYYFVQGVLVVFGNKWGAEPRTKEELDTAIWDQLLLSYEAFRRGIVISRGEVEEEVTRILNAANVQFDWKNDKEAYGKWVMERGGVPFEIFENQITHLLQIQKLREQLMDSREPRITEKEMYQEFLNERNSLSLEITEFGNKKDADLFYVKVRKNRKFWDEERKKRPGDFKGPGSTMSLEAYIDLWKIPKRDCHKMIRMKKGDIYHPTPIYKGYGVFRIHAVRRADRSQYPALKNNYYEQIRSRRRLEGFNQWFERLKAQANITVYDELEAVPAG